MFKHKEALCLIWREKEDYVDFIAVASLFQSELLGCLIITSVISNVILKMLNLIIFYSENLWIVRTIEVFLI